jgi:hypothetical protein
MRFWTREIAGWLLLGLGLYVFYRDYQVLMEGNHWVVEGVLLTVIGIFLFRGGIQLLKIAVAARVCMEAQGLRERDRARPDVASTMIGRRPSPYAEKTSAKS